MKLRLRHCVLVCIIAALTPAVLPQQAGLGGAEEEQRNSVELPNGKLQKDEILKAEYKQNLKDAAHLVELSQQLQLELEKSDRFVLSLDTLKKTDEIEKLAKKIRSRLRHN